MPGLSDIAKLGAPAVGALYGMTHSDDAEAIFAGPLAKQADEMMLNIAKKMSDEGYDPREIFQKTGWTQMPDQQWKFEIPDTDAMPLKVANDVLELSGIDPRPGRTFHYQYGDSYDIRNMNPEMDIVFEHDELYKNYPSLGYHTQHPTTTRQSLNRVRGSYNPRDMEVRINPELTPAEARSTTIHELQHGVQEHEAWPQRGGSPSLFSDKPRSEVIIKRDKAFNDSRALAKRILRLQDIRRDLPIGSEEYRVIGEMIDRVTAQREDVVKARQSYDAEAEYLKPQKQYQHLYGEAEARLAQYRAEQGHGRETHPIVSLKQMLEREGNDIERLLYNPADSPALKPQYRAFRASDVPDTPRGTGGRTGRAQRTRTPTGPIYTREPEKYPRPRAEAAMKGLRSARDFLGILYPEATDRWLEKIATGGRPNWTDRIDVAFDWL